MEGLHTPVPSVEMSDWNTTKMPKTMKAKLSIKQFLTKSVLCHKEQMLKTYDNIKLDFL